jgi:hypothetical protein
MAAYHVPGVRIAVIHNGSIEWAQGFWRRTSGRRSHHDPDLVPASANRSLRWLRFIWSSKASARGAGRRTNRTNESLRENGLLRGRPDHILEMIGR